MVKNECCERLKMSFFLEVFEREKIKSYFGKARQSLQNLLTRSLPQGAFHKIVLRLSCGEERMFWAFTNGVFCFYANFGVAKLTPFSEGKAFKTVQLISLSWEAF